MDTQLHALGLTRSLSKTQVLAAEDIEAELMNALIAYFAGGGRRLSRADAISMFHGAIAGPLHLNALKFSVSCFASDHDHYPPQHLLGRAEFLDQIPKQLYQLVRALARHSPPQASLFFPLLGDSSLGDVAKNGAHR